MSMKTLGPGERIWAAVEREDRIDLWIRIIAFLAWGTTLGMILLYGYFEYYRVGIELNQFMDYSTSWFLTLARSMPLVKALGAFSLLVGTLCTVAMFLRFRTSSLSEIQARLASIEQALLERGE